MLSRLMSLSQSKDEVCKFAFHNPVSPALCLAPPWMAKIITLVLALSYTRLPGAQPYWHAEAEARSLAKLERAQAQVDEAMRELQAADDRAMAAEMAKIQLSMKLAEMDDSQRDGQGLSSPSHQAETSFADSIMTRRVASAEQEVEVLRQKLQDAETTIGQLEFQVQCERISSSADPPPIMLQRFILPVMVGKRL